MSVLQQELALADLNRFSGYDRFLLQEVNDVFRGNGFFSADATTFMLAGPGLGRSLSGRSQGSDFSLRRVFARDGFCAADLPGETEGYRSLFKGDESKTLSYDGTSANAVKMKNLDCHLRLPARGDHEKAAEHQAVALHNSTGFECVRFRKNAAFTGISEHGLLKWGWRLLQPFVAVELILEK